MGGWLVQLLSGLLKAVVGEFLRDRSNRKLGAEQVRRETAEATLQKWKEMEIAARIATGSDPDARRRLRELTTRPD